MKRWKYVESVAPILTMSKRLGVKSSDISRIPIYHDYIRRKTMGEKVEAILMDISIKHGISRGEMFKFIRRMNEDV